MLGRLIDGSISIEVVRCVFPYFLPHMTMLTAASSIDHRSRVPVINIAMLINLAAGSVSPYHLIVLLNF